MEVSNDESGRDRGVSGHGGERHDGFRHHDIFNLSDGDFPQDVLGLAPSLPEFIAIVDAVIAAPANPFINGGENGASGSTSQVYWLYSPGVGLLLEAAPGFLTTQTGNGGFNLFVGADGKWSLTFDGSATTIGSSDTTPVPPPPATNTMVTLPAGPSYYDASAGNITVNGGTGYDTIGGGAGDYMIGGSGTLGGGLAGNGNCAIYTDSATPVLVDVQNGAGYGGTAEGNVLVNINQVRGSYNTNVLIGAATGTDLKSGGSNSILISTGGSGFELRPDGNNNILVSTVGADRINFDYTHAWLLGDTGNTLLGWNPSHGDFLDLSLLLGGGAIKEVGGGSVTSDFFTASAAGYDPATGHGNIADYVGLVNEADGTHVMFSATGQVQTAGTEILDMKDVYNQNVQTLFAHGNIVA